MFRPQAPRYCKDRALRTLTGGLEVKRSRIPTGGQGVFVKETTWLPANSEIGPYEGRIVRLGNNAGYCWQVIKGEQ